jgi:predicted nucleotidyltransferase
MTSPVSLRAVIPEALAATIRAIGARYRIRNIRVFGSLARGDARPDSDVDLLVEYVAGGSGFDFVSFCDEVEVALGRKVDVVTDDSLHPRVRERILAQAVPI